MATRDDEPITIEMPSRVVSGIDAEIDNASQTAFEDGDEDLGNSGLAIRDAISAGVPSDGGDWPPDDQVLTITLTRAQWQYVVSETNGSTPVYVQLGDEESADLGRRAVAAIEPHLS